MSINLTIAVPPAHLSNANQLALACGYSLDDVSTYGEPRWQDAAGNLYSAANFMSAILDQSPMEPLTRPEWDVGEQIDMTAAAQAQAAILYWTEPTDDLPEVPQSADHPGRIVVIGGPSGIEALAMMGLTAVPQSEDPPL